MANFQCYGFYDSIPDKFNNEDVISKCFHKLDSDVNFRRVIFLEYLHDHVDDSPCSDMYKLIDSWVFGIDTFN